MSEKLWMQAQRWDERWERRLRGLPTCRRCGETVDAGVRLCRVCRITREREADE